MTHAKAEAQIVSLGAVPLCKNNILMDISFITKQDAVCSSRIMPLLKSSAPMCQLTGSGDDLQKSLVDCRSGAFQFRAPP